MPDACTLLDMGIFRAPIKTSTPMPDLDKAALECTFAARKLQTAPHAPASQTTPSLPRRRRLLWPVDETPDVNPARPRVPSGAPGLARRRLRLRLELRPDRGQLERQRRRRPRGRRQLASRDLVRRRARPIVWSARRCRESRGPRADASRA